MYVSHLICFPLYMYSYLVPNLLISSPLSHSLYFSLFSLNLLCPLYSFLFLSLAFSLYISLSLFFALHTLSLFLSLFQFFFLSIILCNSLSLCSIPPFLPLPLDISISLVSASPYIFFLVNSSLCLSIHVSLIQISLSLFLPIFSLNSSHPLSLSQSLSLSKLFSLPLDALVHKSLSRFLCTSLSRPDLFSEFFLLHLLLPLSPFLYSYLFLSLSQSISLYSYLEF